MADTARSAAGDLGRLAEIIDAPHRHNLFAVLRWLESGGGDRPRLGRSERPREDTVKIGQAPDVSFATSTIAEIKTGRQAGTWEVSQYAFGLFGPNGPMPLHLTDYVRHRKNFVKDPTFCGFVDMFHHRLASFFYRAWADGEPALQRDRAGEDRFSAYVAKLCGLGGEALSGRDAFPDDFKLFFAASLANHSKHPEGLVAILQKLFDVKVALTEFVADWLVLPDADRVKLGGMGAPRLGEGCILGGRVWSAQHGFQLTVGPLSSAKFKQLLPGGSLLAPLVAVVRNYIGDELSCRLNLVLDQGEVPNTRLGESGQLGWTSWMARRKDAGDANEMYLNLN